MIVTSHPTQEDQFKRKPILNSCILLQHAQKKDEMKITRKKDLQIRALAVGDQGKRVNTDRSQIPPVPRSPDR
eukprot:scaffold11395_cov182-Skeletonema_marinoi.AAC.5